MYPFEKFTARAKHVLEYAQKEAEKAHHHYIGTEHLLLGLLREHEGMAAKVLDNFDVRTDRVREAIEAVLGRSERARPQQIIPTSRVKKVIEMSFEEARRMGHQYVGTEHLLLGLLVEGEGIAAHVLDGMGVTLERARAEIERMLRSGDVPRRAPGDAVGFALISPHLRQLLQQARARAVLQGSGVTRLDHLLEVLVEDADFKTLAEVLDRLGVPWNPPEEVRKLAERYYEISRERGDAAGRLQQEASGALRDEEIRVSREYERAEREWLESVKKDRPDAP
jgi:ATP-dependent Clp protease ATP-binding subunit ClpA